MIRAARIAAALAFAAASQAAILPGIINSVDGEVSVNGAPVNASSAGTAFLQPGQAIKTGRGMAEILLTPGTFLRLGDHSTLNIEAVAAERVQGRLVKGEALVEALEVPHPDSTAIELNGAKAVVTKPGLYDFNQSRGAVAVYQGSARLARGAKQIDIDAGSAARVRNLRQFQTAPDTSGALYAWSNFRSEQLSLESASSAQTYSGSVPQFRGPAWYWDPWTSSYTLLSASGFVNGPFGWPFYAPGHSHNYIPEHRGGDWYLYGPPVVPVQPGAAPPATPGVNSRPTVPLTAPGVPTFPNSRRPHFGRP